MSDISIKIVCLALLISLVSAHPGSAGGQGIFLPENARAYVEAEVEGRLCTISIATEFKVRWALALEDWEVDNIALTFEVSHSAGQSGLTVDVSGNASFRMFSVSQNPIRWIEYIALNFDENSEELNPLVLWLLENMGFGEMFLPFAEVDNIRVIDFSLDQRMLSFSLALDVTGERLNDPALLDELPFSGELVMGSSGGLTWFSIRNMRGNTSEINFSGSTGQTTQSSLRIKFEMPPLSSGGCWLRFPAWCKSLMGSESDVEEIVSRNSVSLYLRVPQDAWLTNLPSGHQKVDEDTYRWSENSAPTALAALITGSSGTAVSYPSDLSMLILAAVLIAALIVAGFILFRLRRRSGVSQETGFVGWQKK